jgi:hypothetical protein
MLELRYVYLVREELSRHFEELKKRREKGLDRYTSFKIIETAHRDCKLTFLLTDIQFA